MTQENTAKADPLDDGLVIDGAEEVVSQPSEVIQEPETKPEADPAESVPADEPEKPKEDGFQKRINKVTAQKYEAERKAEALQAELEKSKAKPSSEAPTLEGFGFDDDKFQQALADHRAKQAFEKIQEEQRQAEGEAQSRKALELFEQQIETLGKPDFNDVANAIPTLPEGVAGTLMQSEGGAEMIYHLGTHLDLADKIASMTPAQAMMEIGRISANMTAKPVKPSAAPEPIAPLIGGGGLPSGEQDDGTVYE